VPDECELAGNDCDQNGIPDECDEDCDGSGVPDACEQLSDCNANGTPDSCDIADGSSLDANQDGIPDECSFAVAYCFGDDSGASCPCGNSSAAGLGCANSSGGGGLLFAGGSPSVAADDVTFHARGLLISQAALLFTGTSRIQSGAGLPFGDGLRCAGGQIRRLGVRLPGPDGAADWDFGGLASGNGWSAGEVRTYQVWYRDSNSSPCGSGYNLTNGLEVTFQP